MGCARVICGLWGVTPNAFLFSWMARFCTDVDVEFPMSSSRVRRPLALTTAPEIKIP